jgi:hypothetical protein
MKKLFNVDKNNENNSPEYSRILENILPDSEILKTQSIKEYQEWALEKDRLLSEVASRDDGFKLFMRPYRHPIAKRFYEEIKPLAAFLELQKFLKSTDMVQLSPDDADYDACISDNNGNVFYIEITVIYKDEQDVLGDIILNKQGHFVNGAKVEKIGNKMLAYDSLSAPFEFNDILDETLRKIKVAIKNKNKKDYPKKTLLVIGGICNGEYLDQDKSKIQSVLEETNSDKFTGTFFVDLNKRVFCYKNWIQ